MDMTLDVTACCAQYDQLPNQLTPPQEEELRRKDYYSLVTYELGGQAEFTCSVTYVCCT